MATFQARGSWGALTVDANTGRVLALFPGGEALTTIGDGGYDGIIRLDVSEWKSAHRRCVPENEDILDFGYWYRAGFESENGSVRYEPPAADWREEYAQHSRYYRCEDGTLYRPEDHAATR